MNDLIRPALYESFHRIWPVAVPPGLPAAARGLRGARSPGPSPGTSSARSARAATSWPRTAPCPGSIAAPCSPSSRPGPTAWSWPPTTTPAPAPPRSSSMGRRPGWSAAARPTTTCSRRSSTRWPRPEPRDDATCIDRGTDLPPNPPPARREGFAGWLRAEFSTPSAPLRREGLGAVRAGLDRRDRAWPDARSCPRPRPSPRRPAPSLRPAAEDAAWRLWDAADYLVRTGQAAQAVPYLKQFLAEPTRTTTTLIAIRDRYGAGVVPPPGRRPETRPFAQPVLERAARRRRAPERDPARPDRAVHRRP